MSAYPTEINAFFLKPEGDDPFCLIARVQKAGITQLHILFSDEQIETFIKDVRDGANPALMERYEEMRANADVMWSTDDIPRIVMVGDIINTFWDSLFKLAHIRVGAKKLDDIFDENFERNWEPGKIAEHLERHGTLRLSRLEEEGTYEVLMSENSIRAVLGPSTNTNRVARMICRAVLKDGCQHLIEVGGSKKRVNMKFTPLVTLGD